MSWMRWAPFAVFAVLGALFATQLLAPEQSCPRPAVGLQQSVPGFDVAKLPPETGRFTNADLAGDGVTVVNMWASWCAPCRAEHPFLMALAETPGLRMVGVNYKDKPAAGRRFLAELGDPFETVAFDPDGQAAVAFGLTGVPETFVLNSKGEILYRHVGPINPGELESCLYPAIAKGT